MWVEKNYCNMGNLIYDYDNVTNLYDPKLHPWEESLITKLPGHTFIASDIIRASATTSRLLFCRPSLRYPKSEEGFAKGLVYRLLPPPPFPVALPIAYPALSHHRPERAWESEGDPSSYAVRSDGNQFEAWWRKPRQQNPCPTVRLRSFWSPSPPSPWRRRHRPPFQGRCKRFESIYCFLCLIKVCVFKRSDLMFKMDFF